MEYIVTVFYLKYILDAIFFLDSAVYVLLLVKILMYKTESHSILFNSLLISFKFLKEV